MYRRGAPCLYMEERGWGEVHRTMNKEQRTIFWFRRDLRLTDNTGLTEALKAGHPVMPLFIFDTNILGKLSADDRRVEFIHQQLIELDTQLRKYGSGLYTATGIPLQVIGELLKKFSIKSVYANRDFEPYGVERDTKVKELLAEQGVKFHAYTDHLIMEPGMVVRPDGKPYEVYTSFKNQWLRQFAELKTDDHFATHPFESDAQSGENYLKYTTPAIPTLHDLAGRGAGGEGNRNREPRTENREPGTGNGERGTGNKKE